MQNIENELKYLIQNIKKEKEEEKT